MASQQAMDVAQPHVEHTPLLRTEELTAEAEAETGPKQPSVKGKTGVAVLFAIAATAAFAGGVRSSMASSSAASLKVMDGDDASALSIQLDTDYTLRGDAAPGSDYPWMTFLLEPHQITTASVVNGGSDSSFTWTFDGATKSGSSVDLQCKNVDKYYTILVDEYDSDGNQLGG